MLSPMSKPDVPEAMVVEFRKAVHAWMQENGGPYELSRQSGVARSTINNWLERESAPTLEAAIKVSRVIGFKKIRG